MNIRGVRTAFSWSDIGKLLKHRQIARRVDLGQFGGNSMFFFFVILPPDISRQRPGVQYLSFINAGMMTMLPYIGASIGVLVAG